MVDVSESRREAHSWFRAEAIRRVQMSHDLLPNPADSKEVKQAKGLFFLEELLPEWASDPVKFITDCAYAPDPTGYYGSEGIKRGTTYEGMIPVILFDRQRELVRAWWEGLNCGGKFDLFMEKSRQEAATTILLWCALHSFLFRASTTGVLGSYARHLIDAGGKGQRDPTSMFGRLRKFLDALIWLYPVLKFNQDAAPPANAKRETKLSWMRNHTGFGPDDDISYKLTRPRWTVYNREIFPDSKGNWLQGALPSDKFGRSNTGTFALLDELYHYNAHLEAGADVEAYSASSSNFRVRVGWGTVPRGGAMNTFLYEEIHARGPREGKRCLRIHWTDNPIKMLGAAWVCRDCEHHNLVSESKPPAWEGEMRRCGLCGSDQIVVAKGTESGGNMTSHWYREACASTPDKVGIAAELDIDVAGATTNTVFSNFDPKTAIQPRRDVRGWLTIQGFDPGYSEKNPAAWSMWLYSPEIQRLRLVAYHQAANWDLEKWVPFFHQWSGERTVRQRLAHGSIHRFFGDYDYRPDELALLDRISRFGKGRIRGDKYGSHKDAGAEPAYETLRRRYAIEILYEYVKDDEALIQKVRDVWLPRIEIDPEIANHRPLSLSGQYPSFVQALMTAKWAETAGHREEKRVVSNKEPPHVKHYIDTLKYVVMELDDFVGMERGPDGSWVPIGSDMGSEPFYWGGDGSLT